MSAGANLHPAGQTESGLVSRVPPKAKDRRGLWALHPWGLRAGQSGGGYVDVLSRRKSLKGTGMMDPGETMNREEIAAFLASLKKLRDGLDDFNCQLAAIDGAGMRLSMLCQETAAACPAAAEALAQRLASMAQELRGHRLRLDRGHGTRVHLFHALFRSS